MLKTYFKKQFIENSFKFKNQFQIRYEWVSEWPLYYTAWDSAQPKFLPQSANQCVVQDIETGLWRSDPYCSDKRPFVCKISDHRVSGDQTYVSYVCPKFKNSTTGQTEEWINLHKNLKHCHWFSETVAMNWSVIVNIPFLYLIIHSLRSDASKHCHKRDGTLVSIHSRHESELLKPFLQKYGRPLWIGLYQSPGGFYQWEDGSALDFQNWFPGEPTDEKTELCVEMRAQDMTWNDIDCAGRQLQFICEINKIPTNQTLIENKLNNRITTTDPLNTITVRSEETEGQGLKGWSRVVIWLIMIILVVASVLVIVSYLWWEKIIDYLSEKFNHFSNSGTYSTSSGVDSQRSSVNDRNSFHIHDIN